MVNSRAKGARGERELAKILTDGGFPARRGQQFHGGAESPDVVCESLSHLHFEVKFVEQFNLYAAMQQAIDDAGETKAPVVVHRRKGKDWVAIVRLEDFLEMQKRLKGEQGED